jgi:DNA-binding phage protein
MCKNCGTRWWVQNITDEKIPIEYLRYRYCQNINYDVCRLLRQLEEKNKVLEDKNKALEEKDKALFNTAEIMLKSGINIETIMRATGLTKEEITKLYLMNLSLQ